MITCSEENVKFFVKIAKFVDKRCIQKQRIWAKNNKRNFGKLEIFSKSGEQLKRPIYIKAYLTAKIPTSKRIFQRFIWSKSPY